MKHSHKTHLKSLTLGTALICALTACVPNPRPHYLYDMPQRERAMDSTRSPTERMTNKIKMVFWYLDGKSQLTEMESTLKARYWQHLLNEEGARFPAEYFTARLTLAKEFASKDDSGYYKNAHKLFAELLADQTLTTQQQIKVRMALAREYVFTTKGFKPEDGKDVIKAVMELAQNYVDHPDLNVEEWFKINYAIVYMYCHSARISDLNVEEGRAQAITYCNKILANPAITDAQRKTIEKNLVVLKTPDSNPEKIFAFEPK